MFLCWGARSASRDSEISDYIQPGSRNISSGWAAYAVIKKNVDHEIYSHDVIIQQQNFEDPVVQVQSRDLGIYLLRRAPLPLVIIFKNLYTLVLCLLRHWRNTA